MRLIFSLSEDHCIIRHSLRYFLYSGLVIYKSKLPAPSISMPCDYHILQSPTKGQVKLVLLETVQRSLSVVGDFHKREFENRVGALSKFSVLDV